MNKGYLLENFRLFHLKDDRAPAVEPHYHEFDKVVTLFSGAVDYTVEGARYAMHPGDVLFVRHHDIHRPVIRPDSVYERAILWIAPEFLQRRETPGGSLQTCFDLASERHSCLYRPSRDAFDGIRALLLRLEAALQEDAFGSGLLADAYFLELLVTFNRMVLRDPGETPRDADERVGDALRYIHAHLSEPLRVDDLAAKCYLSRYYFMRRFREATGDTVHGYVLQKRLAAAAEKLDAGFPVAEAARSVGFSDYSAFLRAFKKTFDATPSEYLRRRNALDGEYLE